MKKGPMGVWFSVALTILALGFWLGSMLGSRLAGHWYRHQNLKSEALNNAEREHLDSELAELDAIQLFRTYTLVAQSKKEVWGKSLDIEIRGLEELKRRSRSKKSDQLSTMTSDLRT